MYIEAYCVPERLDERDRHGPCFHGCYYLEEKTVINPLITCYEYYKGRRRECDGKYTTLVLEKSMVRNDFPIKMKYNLRNLRSQE